MTVEDALAGQVVEGASRHGRPRLVLAATKACSPSLRPCTQDVSPRVLVLQALHISPSSGTLSSCYSRGSGAR
jgi:hypothetical protein